MNVLQTVTNFYIANLALSDVILAMFCIPFQFRAALVQRWDLPSFMCQFCPFIQILSVSISMSDIQHYDGHLGERVCVDPGGHLHGQVPGHHPPLGQETE